MTESIQKIKNQKNLDYILPVFRLKKIRDKFLMVNEFGNWCATDKKTINNLLKGTISKEQKEVFEEGCIILTENNIETVVSTLKEKYNILFGGSSLHIIVGTLRCNHKCVYCHAGAKSSSMKSYDLDKKTAKKILKFIFQTPSNDVTIEFQGGEPLINEKIIKYIVKEAKKMNISSKKNLSFAMTSNFTLMTKKTMHWLVSEGVSFCTSLDGSKEIHNVNRRYESGKGSYDDVVKWMEFFSHNYNLPGSALMVATRKSLKRHKQIINEFVRRGITEIQLKQLNKIGYSKNKDVIDKIGYSAEEFVDFWKKSMDYILELNKKGVEIKERYVGLILNKILSKKEVKFMDFRSPCGAAVGQILYNHNGDIYSCDEGRSCNLFKLGNVYTHNLRDVITSENTKNLILSSMTQSYACSYCPYSPFCGLCPVLTYSEQKNIIPKLPKSEMCKINKARFDYIFEKFLFDKDARKILIDWENVWEDRNKIKMQEIKRYLRNNFYIDIHRGVIFDHENLLFERNKKMLFLRFFSNKRELKRFVEISSLLGNPLIKVVEKSALFDIGFKGIKKFSVTGIRKIQKKISNLKAKDLFLELEEIGEFFSNANKKLVHEIHPDYYKKTRALKKRCFLVKKFFKKSCLELMPFLVLKNRDFFEIDNEKFLFNLGEILRLPVNAEKANLILLKYGSPEGVKKHLQGVDKNTHYVVAFLSLYFAKLNLDRYLKKMSFSYYNGFEVYEKISKLALEKQ